jgi:hypothetical protein
LKPVRRVSILSCLVGALVACSNADIDAPIDALPCDVDAVLGAVCQKCHASPPIEGAPISLVTYADTQAPYTSEPLYDGTATWKVIGDQLSAGLMPQAPVTISAADRAVLLDWVGHGAPPAPSGTTCP